MYRKGGPYWLQPRPSIGLKICSPVWYPLNQTQIMKYSLLLLTFTLSASALGQPIWTAEELGHQDWIDVVIFSPDGTRLVSGSKDMNILMRDADTGQELQRFTGHTGQILSVAFSPDGSQLVSGSEDKSIRLWDVTTGNELRQISGHTGPVHSVEFSPSGRQLVSGSEDQSIRLWNAESGEELQRFTGHSGEVNSVTFFSDGTRLISGAGDQSIRLWEISSGRELQSFTGHTGSVNSVDVSPSDALIFSGSDDKTARLWRISDGLEILEQPLVLRDEITSVQFSEDGIRGVYGTNNNQLALLDLAAGRVITLTVPYRNLSSVAFSVNNKHVAWASGQELGNGLKFTPVYVWDITSDGSSGIKTQRFVAHTRHINAIVFSPDGNQLASASWDGNVRLWDPLTGKVLQTSTDPSTSALSLAFSPDGDFLVVGLAAGELSIVEVASGKELIRYTGLGDNILSVAFSPSGTQFASADADGDIHLWDASTGQQLKTFTENAGPANSVEFSPDGTRLISGLSDNSIRMWEVDTGLEIQKFTGHSLSVTSVTFSPDGSMLASASEDGGIRVWEADTGEQLQVLLGHFAPVFSVDFSPDGTQLVSGSAGGHIIRWNVSDGRLLESVQHGAHVFSVAVSPDGKFFASAGRETLKLWDWDAGNTTAPLEFSRSIADQRYPRSESIPPLVLPVATGGTAPIVYTLMPELPAGLNFNASTRTVTGTPTTATDSPVEYTYTATDAGETIKSLLFRIHVYDEPVSIESQSLPESFTIVGNYPNPFQKATELTFDLPWPARVRVEVMDVIGRRVLIIPESSVAAGWSQTIHVDGRSLPSGLYLYRLIANSPSGSSVQTGRFMRVY